MNICSTLANHFKRYQIMTHINIVVVYDVDGRIYDDPKAFKPELQNT